MNDVLTIRRAQVEDFQQVVALIRAPVNPANKKAAVSGGKGGFDIRFEPVGSDCDFKKLRFC